MTNNRLAIITIGYKDEFGVIQTLNSVEEQDKKPYQHVLILKGFRHCFCRFIESKYKANYRVILWDVDKSLFNAMNIGLETAQGDFVLFLNSGDAFLSQKAITIFDSTLQKGKIGLYPVMQCYHKQCYIRKGPKWQHSGVVVPLLEGVEKKFYDEMRSLSADTHWIESYLQEYDTIVNTEVLIKIELGGISNTPSFNKSLIYYKTEGQKRFLLECLKTILLFFIGYRRYYALLAKIKRYQQCDADTYKK